MFQKCLLILTHPLTVLKTRLPKLIGAVSRIVSGTLYIYLQPLGSHTEQFQLSPLLCTAEMQTFIKEIYTCTDTGGIMTSQLADVRVLLGHISNKIHNISEYPVDGYNAIVLDTDTFSQFGGDRASSLKNLLASFPGAAPHADVQLVRELKRASALDKSDAICCSGHDNAKQTAEWSKPLKTYNEVVLGGTFDHFHTGHKILLSEACIHCNKRLTVGVSDGAMNDKKVLLELLEPLEKRVETVRKFIRDVKPTITANVVTIQDPFGPTIVDPDIQCIVVSEETKKGGHAVNAERERRGMKPLEQIVIGLVPDISACMNEEAKVSSSSKRKRLLGSLIRPLRPREVEMRKQPYLIGLTGGIASGKSSICHRLEGYGAGVIHCDALGHEAYAPGSETYHTIVITFGDGIRKENGEIDRAKLGAIVFSDKSKLNQLNQIVWPKIQQLVEKEIDKYEQMKKSVVVLEAAVLLEAGWDKNVHEVWATIIPRSEAIKRLMERNQLSEEEASKRVEMQLTDKERVAKANVVFCTLWEPEYTQMQCEKAWLFLTSRLSL